MPNYDSADLKTEVISRSTRYSDLPDVLTVEEVRSYLDIGRNTIYERVRTGQIHAVRAGRRLLIPKTALGTFLGMQDVAQPSSR